MIFGYKIYSKIKSLVILSNLQFQDGYHVVMTTGWLSVIHVNVFGQMVAITKKGYHG